MSTWGRVRRRGREPGAGAGAAPGRPIGAGVEVRSASDGGSGAGVEVRSASDGGSGAGAASGGLGTGGAGPIRTDPATLAAPPPAVPTPRTTRSVPFGSSDHPGHARPDRRGRVGRRGENVAADYLRQRGYRLLDRNWRSPEREVPGELDLVLRHRGTLVICEVKARTGSRLAHPAEAVTPEKAARLRKLAVVWLREHDRRTARRPAPGRLPDFIRAATSFVAPSIASVPARPSSDRSPASIRIDVVAVRLAPREPFPVLSIDHMIGVA